MSSDTCRMRTVVGASESECSMMCDEETGFCVSTYSDPGQRRFHHFSERVPYDQAKQTCESMGLRLASVRNEYEQREIGRMLLPFVADTAVRGLEKVDGVVAADLKSSAVRDKDYLLMNNAWIGLDAGAGEEFEWQDGRANTDPSRGGRYGWGRGQPSRSNAERRCGAMVRSMWNDWNCNMEMGFVCETAPTCQVVTCGPDAQGKQVLVSSPFYSASGSQTLDLPLFRDRYAEYDDPSDMRSESRAEAEGRITRETTVASLLLDKLEEDPRLGPGIAVATELLKL